LEAAVEAEFGVSLLAKTAFSNDVKITSSLRSVVQVLMGHFTIFKSHGHGLSGWFVQKIMKSCRNLSKLRPKDWRTLFPGHRVLSTEHTASIDVSVFCEN